MYPFNELIMKNLPIGIQTFEEIINNDYLYVDKTEVINKLITSGKYYFLSRPRRFGKSLLISTLKEIFNGNKELFKGLSIYDKIQWELHPVIHISFSSITYSQSTVIFQNEIIDKLKYIGKQYGVYIAGSTLNSVFNKLLQELSKINNVVILIDEYDKPIIDYITKLNKAYENRDVLRDFYSSIKDNDQYIKFCFLTGVSKFSKVSVFSGLNNLKDITLDDRFSTICGITQDELNIYFDDRIPALSIKDQISEDLLKLKIKQWYNGYSWDGVNTVYNPFSILNYFTDGKFKNYWFSTGTPTFLIDKFRETNFKVENINNFMATDDLFDSYDLENFDYRSLLFQTGYLTIANLDTSNMIYTLNYPNKEVKDSFLTHILTTFIKKEVSDIRLLNIQLQNSLINNDLDSFINFIKSLFAGIPYQLHIEKEAYYHSLFYVIMELVGIEMISELSTSRGRIDGVIELAQYIYIIEFKYITKNQNVEELLVSAINQIRDKEYFAPYIKRNKPIKYLAVALNKEIIEYRIESE